MEKKPENKKRLYSREQLSALDKNDLIEKVLQLEAHNVQLKNIISKNICGGAQLEEIKNKKSFDFSKCHFRRVLLHILYFGWDYQGLVVQEDTNQTIEHHLFHALMKSCLIENRETSKYHRCGRTDKGVSAFGQVISISIRSKHVTDQQNCQIAISTEIPYCKILNRILPKEIRIVSWMPIPDELSEYSARFDCIKRQYKYYFPRANLDLSLMLDACCRIIGSHDFRHLCKMDVGNGVTEFRREIFKADIIPVHENDINEPTSMYYLLIEGNAFLWHQIRCIMGILLLVGMKKEAPNIIDELLDVEKNSRKPQYSMALDLPLNLFHCSYSIDQEWIYDRDELRAVINHLQSEWTKYNVKTTMIKDAIKQLEVEYGKLNEDVNILNQDVNESTISYADCLLQGVKSKVYKPLLDRETCSSLEERIAYFKKRKKLNEK